MGYADIIRLLLCLLLCFALVFCQVLSVPARAIVGVDDAIVLYVLGTLVLTLGYNLATDYAGTTEVLNAMLADIGEVISSPLSHVANMVQSLWDGHSPYVTVGMEYGDYFAITTAITTWFAGHMSEDGSTVHVTVGDKQEVLFNSDNFVYNVPFGIPKFPDEKDLLSYLGNSVLYFGNGSAVLPSIIDVDGVSHTFSVVNCALFGGEGNHSFPLELDSLGNVTLPSKCSSCSNGYLKGGASKLCIFLGSYKSKGAYNPELRVMFYQYWPLKNDNFSAGQSVISRNDILINDSQIDVPISVPGGSIDVPLDKDDDYAPGVVSGAWDGLIGKVGDVAAGSLPFNFPMGSGIASVTVPDVLPDALNKEISSSVDVPAEGDVSLPKVDDLSLPKGIITKFPFCIPFDLKRGVEILSASPVAPSFAIPFRFGGVIDETITLDFDRFTDLIRFCRWFQTAIFTVGLAVVTRKFIKW